MSGCSDLIRECRLDMSRSTTFVGGRQNRLCARGRGEESAEGVDMSC